jgi:hypothetical protein
MWTLAHSALPTTPTDRRAGDLCAVDLGYADPVLAIVDYQAKWRSPDIVRPWEPVTLPVAVPTPSSGSVTVTVPTGDLTHLDTVTVGGQTFTPALDPSNPRPGEYTWTTPPPTAFDDVESDLPIDTVTLYPATPLPANTPVTLTGGKKAETIPTNYLPAKLLDVFKGLPLTGTIGWTLTLEQHPSGSLQLLCQGDTINTLRTRFKQGTEFELFGIGFSVSSYQESVKPLRLYEVSVSLTGKWARPQYNRPAFLRPTAQGLASAVPITDTQQATEITLVDLAKQVGVSFTPLGTVPYAVDIPPDSPKEAAQVWSSGLQELAKANGGYVDWNHAGGVFIRSIDRKQRTHWRYSVPELDITYQGNCEHSEDYRGYAVEYANVQLDGSFQDTVATTPKEPKPTWKSRTPQTITLTSGDTDASTPPGNVTTLKNVSLNWDASGPTKTLRTSTTVDGQPSEETETIYGYCYTAKDIYNSSSQELRGSPGQYWRIVSYKKQTYLYDNSYGYLLGYNVDGYRLSRFKQESDGSLESLGLGAPEDQASYELYTFRSVPLYERSRTIYETFSKHYPDDADEQPAWVAYTHVNRLTYVGSFASTSNPDYDPKEEYSDENPPPPKTLITGEESMMRQSLTLKPSRTTTSKSSDFVGDTAIQERTSITQVKRPDLYTERTLQSSAQNAGFSDYAVQDTFTDYEGRPSPATRKPPLKEPETPEPENGSGTNKNGTQHRYTLCTPGFTVDDPIDGSLSYANARTVEEAQAAAETELMLRDIQESIQYAFVLPFNAKLRPLHRLTLNVQGETHQVAIVSLTQTLNIEGTIDGGPFITTEPTQVNAGIDRTIAVTLHKTALPTTSDATAPVGATTAPDNPDLSLTLGELFTIPLQNRGNY